jgi:WD40 repeat protein
MRSISLMTAVVESLRPKDEGPYAVTSLSLHALGNRAMVSTRKGAAYEVSIWSGLAMPLLAGHVGEELWGLSAHPMDPNVAVSCGEEGSLCKWDLAGRCLDRRVDLKRPAHCCRFSPEGSRVAVGCIDGSVLIVHSEGLTTVQNIKARSTTAMRVTDLAWADDGTWLIGTNKDGTIVVYRSQDAANPKFAAVTTVKASSSGLQPLRVDISADAKVLRCCSAGGARTAFFKTWGAKPVPETEAEGITWRGSASCPSAIELCDMRKRCRAVNCETSAEEEEKALAPQLAMCVHVTARSKDGRFVAFGDARGVIHLFEEEAGTYRSIVAHACHVTALDFNANGTLLLSAGSPDLCVKQWRLL